MYYLFSSYYYHHHQCYYFVDRHLNVVIPAVLGYPCILYSIICSMVMLGRVRLFSIHPPKLISKDNLIRIHQQTSTKPSSTRSYNILNIQIMLSWSVLGCPGVIRLTESEKARITLGSIDQGGYNRLKPLVKTRGGFDRPTLYFGAFRYFGAFW